MDKKEEILFVKKYKDKIDFRIVDGTVKDARKGKWMQGKYQRTISGKDYNNLACLFFDLNNMGYDIEHAFNQFKKFLNEPDLFFLK